MSEVFERLDELGEQMERRYLGVVAHRAKGGDLLHLLCRGTGSGCVVWNLERAAYAWYSGDAHGTLLGRTATDAAEAAARELKLRPRSA